MKPEQIINQLKPLFLTHNFELCEEDYDEEYLNLSFIKEDFQIEIGFNVDDSCLDLTLDRPSLGFIDSQVVQSAEEINTESEKFIQKINDLIEKDRLLVHITKNECELFLKTGSYNGISSGVIEYQGSLYYIDSITNTYIARKSTKDRKNRVWRHFYVYEMTKQELEKVVMSSLDWMRHINLSSLCKDWNSLRLNTGEEKDHNKYFKGKDQQSLIPDSKPSMKLTLFY